MHLNAGPRAVPSLASLVSLAFVALIASAAMVWPAREAAAQAAPRFSAIVDAVDRVARGVGPLNSADYEAFWKRLGDPKADDRIRMIAELRRSVYLVYDYNYQKQICALQAWRTREVPTCPEAEARYQDIRVWQRSVGADSDPMAQSHAVFLNVLRSAARRGEVDLGATGMRVSESGLQNNLEKSARALERLNTALQPSFQGYTAQQGSQAPAPAPSVTQPAAKSAASSG